MTSRTLAWGAAKTVIEVYGGRTVRITCQEHGCKWNHDFATYPGRGVSVDNIILEMNMHASKEH